MKLCKVGRKSLSMFQQAVSVDLVVCWTWVFNGGQWRAFRKSLSIYDEEVLKARDFVLSEARKTTYGGCICYAITHPRSGLDRFDLVITLRHDYYPMTPHA